jgi:hypothetical protein
MCNSKQLTVEQIGAPKITTCVFCDPNFNHCVRTAHIDNKVGNEGDHPGFNDFDGEKTGNFNRRNDPADNKRRFNNKVTGANHTGFNKRGGGRNEGRYPP